MGRGVGIECLGLIEGEQCSSGEFACGDLSIRSVRRMHAFIHLPPELSEKAQPAKIAILEPADCLVGTCESSHCIAFSAFQPYSIVR